MGKEALRRTELPGGIISYYSSGALARNARVKETETFYRTILLSFKSNLGPIGSEHPHIPIRSDGISGMASHEGSDLAEYWGSSPLDTRATKFGVPPEVRVHTPLWRSPISRCNINGGKCVTCT